MITLHHGDNLQALKSLADESIDSVVTDPPYGISFMNKKWDHAVPTVEFWKEVYRVLKPGGHVLSFSGTRTYHRMTVNIEDAGFEIRDQIGWLYGTGFPKSTKMTDEWEGWGSALKPAWEPCVMARKPFKGTIMANVRKFRVGALNIDECRTPSTIPVAGGGGSFSAWRKAEGRPDIDARPAQSHSKGRWPANVVHDGSPEVMDEFAKYGERKSCKSPSKASSEGTILGGKRTQANLPMDEGTAARFFYSAKASKEDRAGSTHPTVKPISLMEWLVKLVTPPGGTVLDPFAGSGTTGQAARNCGFTAVLMEREDQYVHDMEKRFSLDEKSIIRHP